jgi:polar amino acid transport system substrate-binding protein
MNRVLIFLLLTSNLCIAQEQLRVAFGNTLPPWVLKDKNKGIIYDILVECLINENITVIPKYYPYSRRITAFKENKVEAVIDINSFIIEEHKLIGFKSETAYAYINYAISLKEKEFKFEKIRDLLNFSLLSWQGAITKLGGEYARMAKEHKRYTETYNQQSQVKMLFSKRVDVIQMDLQIFKYFRLLNSKNTRIDTSQDVQLHNLFGKSSNSFFFKSKKINDLFNKNFKKIKKSGRLQEILDSYSKK